MADACLRARDLLRLAARLGRHRLRRAHERDAAAVGQRWAREVMERGESGSLDLSLLGRRVRVVGDGDESARILATPPVSGGCPAGRFKRFLAPNGLTIAEDEPWVRLRAFNERVLATGRVHPFAPAFLARVREAFARPVRGKDDIRDAMGRAMEGIVFGDAGAGRRLAEDARILFDVVASPPRRALLGFLYRRRRERFYAQLDHLWDRAAAGEQTLMALARHPPAGAAADAATLSRLGYLQACLLEAGRLYPPVARTFHREDAQRGEPGEPVPGESVEIVHDFSLLQRDPALGESVHSFRPERWLAPQLDAAARASNLFLRGPRVCPGADLILFVCKAAAARLLAEHGLVAHEQRLARDPLPVSFPWQQTRFSATIGRRAPASAAQSP